LLSSIEYTIFRDIDNKITYSLYNECSDEVEYDKKVFFDVLYSAPNKAFRNNLG